MFEYFPEPVTRITLFGMGHVASTLVTILGEMQAKIAWVDSRENLARERETSALARQCHTASVSVDARSCRSDVCV
ncbi:hypothetical protein P4S72_15545 [Vibrio sp. PP-XX7]